MADFLKPVGMSDELWEDISDDFNGEDANAHKKYFTLGVEGSETAPEQSDLDRWYASVVTILGEVIPTKASEVTYDALHPSE